MKPVMQISCWSTRIKLTPEQIEVALRFDGYRYLEKHPEFDPREAYEMWLDTGDWDHLTTNEQLASFFHLQRFLGKWGGEQLSEGSGYRLAFQELYEMV